jgi:N-acetylneuraminic acid mutarotase
VTLTAILWPLVLALGLQSPAWQAAPALPRPVSNNAVVALETSSGPAVFSLLGLDSTVRWNGVVNWAFRWNAGDRVWREIAPVPGPGRLAATAQAVGGRIYLFGGYTVAQDGSERSLPNLDILDPETGEWSAGAPIPVPVDDAVSGVWRDSLIYLVSGWHDDDNVPDVQLYDPATDTWRQATPIPGRPVFGHAGAIVGNSIVYIDGVRTNQSPPRFTMYGASWRGDIDPRDPTSIDWRRVTDHPGPPLYRAGAVGIDGAVVFAGGTNNPYNYDGIGYNSWPSDPRRAVFRYHPATDRWSGWGELRQPVMDLRGIVVAGGRLVIVGGMTAAQWVSDSVWTADLTKLPSTP